MTQVWELDLAGSEMLVLLALADFADDKGRCWPSVPTLSAKTRKSERTVQSAIRALERRGLLKREERPGRSSTYTIQLSARAATPAKAAPLHPPPQELPLTPAKAAGNPSGTTNPPNDAIASSPPGGGTAKIRTGRIKRGKRTSFPAYWQPPPIGDLPPITRAKVGEWADGAYRIIAEEFRLEAIANGWRRADWAAAWCAHLSKVHFRILRQMSQGAVFSMGRKLPAETPAQAEAQREATLSILKLQASERGTVAAVRDALARELGERSYNAYLRPTVFNFDGNTVTVVAASAFTADWAVRQFGGRIEAEFARQLGHAVLVRSDVLDPAGDQLELPPAAPDEEAEAGAIADISA